MILFYSKIKPHSHSVRGQNLIGGRKFFKVRCEDPTAVIDSPSLLVKTVPKSGSQL